MKNLHCFGGSSINISLPKVMPVENIDHCQSELNSVINSSNYREDGAFQQPRIRNSSTSFSESSHLIQQCLGTNGANGTLRKTSLAAENNNLDRGFQEPLLDHSSLRKEKCSLLMVPRLYKITDVPEYLQFNPYVLTGYRRPNLKFWESIYSLCYIHNETVNILTHGISLIYFLVFMPQHIPWDKIDYPLQILAYFHIMGCVSPWLGSTIYHLFMNHKSGKYFYQTLLKWDVIGIWITQSFGASTTVYTSVALYPRWFKYTFIGLYIIIALRALRDSMMACCVWRRRLGFGFLVTMRAIAFVLRLSAINYGEASLKIHLMMQEVLPILGAVISATRVPERWLPGRFDYAFNSHNIMHVFVVLGALHMHWATCTDLTWLSSARSKRQ